MKVHELQDHNEQLLDSNGQKDDVIKQLLDKQIQKDLEYNSLIQEQLDASEIKLKDLENQDTSEYPSNDLVDYELRKLQSPRGSPGGNTGSVKSLQTQSFIGDDRYEAVKAQLK